MNRSIFSQKFSSYFSLHWHPEIIKHAKSQLKIPKKIAKISDEGYRGIFVFTFFESPRYVDHENIYLSDGGFFWGWCFHQHTVYCFENFKNEMVYVRVLPWKCFKNVNIRKLRIIEIENYQKHPSTKFLGNSFHARFWQP